MGFTKNILKGPEQEQFLLPTPQQGNFPLPNLTVHAPHMHVHIPC